MDDDLAVDMEMINDMVDPEEQEPVSFPSGKGWICRYPALRGDWITFGATVSETRERMARLLERKHGGLFEGMMLNCRVEQYRNES